ncbi:hypothetical protein PC129_g11332 [Phytophthora cactorum]|uniref:Serine-threonine/tyrosine-protein kinase catalytic domain-containing protein n=1 Tax=Phytophthora cactorum TaxID=29920 RepID=A0A8T0Z3U3_9STRA|nr:hypothetical protein PC112_g15842 [Phytophthora cactorum]KAG2856769.1 hypothetical protein PC113_g11286 [Phytophthora cactorum]KAG2890199.1 hypothetical protein PC114_g17596 [Phytophthora cactorum]KAG2903398.1 hypothetical protein PC115_g15339 [Phytophthora cactorum]KAG2972265.1 hypothetical protein PC118_g15788 [Phytophthora cactorum]
MVPVRRRGAFFLFSRYRRRRRVPVRTALCLVCLLLLWGDCQAAGDLVARLYDLETSGSSVAKLSLSSSALPSAVSARLSSYSLSWSELSGLMQRALLWDSGFVFASPVGSSSSSSEGDDVKLVQIYTSCSQGMSDLLPGLAEIRTLQSTGNNSNCDVQDCGIIGHFLPDNCPVESVIPLTRCAVRTSDMDEQNQFAGVFWAEDGRSTSVPEPVLRRHTPVDTEPSEALFAVHMSESIFTGTESCQPHTNFILPCRGVAEDVAITSNSGRGSFTANGSSFTEVDLCPASQGAAMNAWLELQSVPSPETFSTTAIVLLSVAMLISVGLGASAWWLSRSRAWLQDAYDRVILEGSWDDGCWSPTSHLLGGPLAPSLAVAAATDEERLTPMEVFFGARPRSRRSPGIHGTSALVATTRAEITLSNDQLCRKSSILRAFVSDPAIVTKRISFAQLHFLRLLAKGGSEIDTCALPYGFSRHAKMRSMQIVHLVSEGKLLPNFRDDCPPAIRDLAQRCLSLDPAARPTAMEVAFELRSTIAPQLLQQPISTVVDVDGSIISSASSISMANFEDDSGAAPPAPVDARGIGEDANTQLTLTER